MVQKIIYKLSKFLYYKFAFKLENEEKRQLLLKEINENNQINLKIEEDSINSLEQLFKGVTLNCFDIGGANDLQPHWFKIQKFANFFSFEPDERSYSELVLKKQHLLNYRIFNCALGSKNEIRPFYLYNEKTGSTLYDFKENYVKDYTNKYIYPIEQIQIETKTLDFIITENNISFVNLIKLDVQGAELEILKGLTFNNIWKNIYCVELEVNFHDVYEGASNFPDVKAFFEEKGFVLFDLRIERIYDVNNDVKNQLFNEYFGTIKPIPSISAKIWEADHIYIRDINWVLKNINDFEDFKKYLIILITYNFYYDAIKIVIEWFNINSSNIEHKFLLIELIQKIHKNDRKNVSKFENYLTSVDYKIWAQYMEVEFPSY